MGWIQAEQHIETLRMMAPLEIGKLRTRNVAIVGILAGSCLLAGCRSTPTTPATPGTPVSSGTSGTFGNQSAIDAVRNGYLKYNRTTTIGQALEHTFSKGTWKSFTTEKGTTVVEFDGSHPFGKLNNLDTEESSCPGSLACAALLKKIDDDCNSNPNVVSYKAAYNSITTQRNSVNLIQKRIDNAPGVEELVKRDEQLQDQLRNLTDPKPDCMEDSYKHNANTPIPVAVQFSINVDGGFQYVTNSLGWKQEKLFHKMYE